MKNNLLAIFIVLSVVSFTQAQIPNAGFENWTGSEPDGWITSNFLSFITNVTQTAESHSGSSAIKLTVESFTGLPYSAHIISGFPVSQRYASLRGYYKLTSSTNKVVEVTVLLSKEDNYVSGAIMVLDNNLSDYTEFVVPIDYDGSSNVPDSAIINFYYVDTTEPWTTGGNAFIDDLSLSGVVDVKEIAGKTIPTTFDLLQNYPNPFNPSTKIEYLIPEESFVELKVYNLIGQEIAVLVNQYQKAGTYRADFNATGMQSGIYIAKLTAGGFTRSVKMTLLK